LSVEWIVTITVAVGIVAIIVLFLALVAAGARDDQLIRKARDL
jgi:hypothetical protein